MYTISIHDQLTIFMLHLIVLYVNPFKKCAGLHTPLHTSCHGTLCSSLLTGFYRIDQCLHRAEVTGKSLTPGGRDPICTLGSAANEGLLAGQVAGLLQLSKMDSQHTVADNEPLLERGEVQRSPRLQSGQHPKPNSAVDHRIEAIKVNRWHVHTRFDGFANP